MRHLQHAHGARHADRAASHHRLDEGHGLTVGSDEEFVCHRSGCCFPSIKCLDIAAIEMQHECATADAATLRLRQCQHHLDGDGGIYRAAPGLQDLVARVGRQRVSRRHGEFGGGPTGLFGIAR